MTRRQFRNMWCNSQPTSIWPNLAEPVLVAMTTALLCACSSDTDSNKTLDEATDSNKTLDEATICRLALRLSRKFAI